MRYSLNEVEATAKKAARGAGYTWGLSEEAGKATRWLCQHNIDGCVALARLMKQFDGTAAAQWAPHIQSNEWTAKSGRLCPLIVGSSFSDYANSLQKIGLRLHQVADPALLFFFAAMTAQQRGTTVSLLWPGTIAATDGERMSIDGNTESDVQSVIVEFGGVMGRLNKLSVRAEPDPIAWNTLNCFAQRTYAPTTEQSRLVGAGTGFYNDD